MIVDKVLFGGTNYIVIDKFEYDGVEYIYAFQDISKKIKGKAISDIKEEIVAKADFIYKCNDGMYENVVDDELYNKLMILVNKRNMYGINDIYNK